MTAKTRSYVFLFFTDEHFIAEIVCLVFYKIRKVSWVLLYVHDTNKQQLLLDGYEVTDCKICNYQGYM